MTIVILSILPIVQSVKVSDQFGEDRWFKMDWVARPGTRNVSLETGGANSRYSSWRGNASCLAVKSGALDRFYANSSFEGEQCPSLSVPVLDDHAPLI